MKVNKNIDVSQFVTDSSTNETNVATGDVGQNMQNVPTAMIEQAKPTRFAEDIAPTPYNKQTGKARQTVSTLASKQSEQTRPPEESVYIEPNVPNGRDGVTGYTMPIIPNKQIESAQPAQPHRVSSRQRRASLEEYREIFMTAPKIIDRQPVFVSREVRDQIDQLVRRLGKRKMSVSGFLENLARHHLDLYADDLEQWKRL